MIKNKKFIYLSIILLVLIGSILRFSQLNKNRWNKSFHSEYSKNELFNLNGVMFKLNKTDFTYLSDQPGYGYLNCYISFYKNGKIQQEKFTKTFPKYYPNLITLNVYDKTSYNFENFESDSDLFKNDNKKFIEIQNDDRELKDKQTENLKLTFKLKKSLIEDIYKNKINARIVFPNNENKSFFYSVNIK